MEIRNNQGLVALYVGPDSSLALQTMGDHACVLTAGSIPRARYAMGRNAEIGILIVDHSNADPDFMDTYARFVRDAKQSHHDVYTIVISNCQDDEFSGLVDKVYPARDFWDSNAKIVTRAGHVWANRHAKSLLKRNAGETLFAYANSDKPSTLERLVELAVEYIDVSFLELAILKQTARLKRLVAMLCLSSAMSREDAAKAALGIIIPHQSSAKLLAALTGSNDSGAFLEILSVFDAIACAGTDPQAILDQMRPRFAEDNVGMTILSQILRNHSAEVVAIYA